MKRLTLFLLCLFAGLGWATAQNRTVKGTVISSEDNLPLIGVNVVVVGNTNIGVATNIDGEFTLSVPESAKQLKFSSIGMKDLVLDIKPEMHVTMSPDQEMLDAVVVVGYGTGQKVGTVTGSVARVSSEKLENKPVANVMDALQGQVSGMNVTTASGDPNAVASVNIHGVASLGASSSPLYIVDGVQTSAAIVMAMNQNDIETFTVLKDASSTSIYGARAANGVIVITTKKGKRNQDGAINVSALYGVSKLISDRPMKQLMTGQEHLDYILRHQKDDKARASYLAGLKGTSFNGVIAEDGKSATVNGDTDWLKIYMGKLAPTYQVDMSITGGSDNISYFVSGGYFSQEGISAETSKYQKFNLRSSFDARVKEWLRVGMNISGGIIDQLSASGFGKPYVNAGTFGALVMPRFYSPYKRNQDGSLNTKELVEGVRVHREYPTGDGVFFLPQYKNQFEKTKYHTYRLNASGYAESSPIEGLTLKTQLGAEFNVDNETTRFSPRHPDANGLGSALRAFGNDYTMTWTNTAEYKWNVNDLNKLTFLLGHEFVDYHYDGFSASARGMLSDEFMFLQMGQRGNYLGAPSESETEYAYLSFFSRVNYSFDDYVAADVTLRHDRSSRFGKNHQGATFFSIGALYDVHNHLLRDHDLISSLRVKANYGTQGNSAIPLYASEALTGYGFYTNKLGFGVTTIGNEDLGWEKQGMLSTGVDLGLFKDRLMLNLSYYHRKTSNMLMDVPLPYSTGYTSRWENIGAMTNQGIDFEFEYNFLKTDDFDCFFRTTMNYNWQRVDKLFSDLTNAEGWAVANAIYRVGKPITMNIAKFAGYEQSTGKQLWYIPGTNDVTSEFSESLRQPLEGYVFDPPFNGGFSLGATFKKQLSLVMDWSFSVGAYTLNNDRFFLENNTRGFMQLNRSKKLLGEWTKNNTEGATASLFNETMSFDDRLIENTSYLRLKNITLSYTLPQSISKKWTGINGVKVYFTGRNLLTVVHKSFNGFDPESSQGGTTLNKFPATQQFVGGIQLTF